MDATELLLSLFRCMFPLAARRRRRPFKSDISAPVKRVRRVKTVLGRGRDRYQRVFWLHSRANYMDLKKKILDAISYDESRTLVVWCPQHVVSNDYVITVLHQYGEVNNFIDNFSRTQHDSERRMWYGTIVEYSALEDARAAFKEIPMHCRHIKVLPLAFVLSIITDCELMYGEFGRNSASTVVVSGRRSVKSEKTLYLYLELSEFGSIMKLLFDYRQTVPGVICKVTYSYFTQAYLAMMMLNGQYCDDVLLSADIEEKERKEIIEQAKKCLMMAIESYF